MLHEVFNLLLLICILIIYTCILIIHIVYNCVHIKYVYIINNLFIVVIVYVSL